MKPLDFGFATEPHPVPDNKFALDVGLLPGEIIVDNFAGGGGASTGIEAALGVPVTIAINHDADAVAMHQVNHPETVHLQQSVWRADPREVVAGRPVGLAWFSPDCKHFSKAKGGKPVEKNIRDLAWVVVHWAKLVKPRIIMLENVEEFADWSDLLADGRPDPSRKGLTFRRWVRELKREGYKVAYRELRASNYGAPTIRKRLFVIARCDGRPIRWPKPTHGPGLLPYRTAAECIDWTLPCPSIFLTREQGRALGVNRPLVYNTMRRLARGTVRFVVQKKRPFIVPLTHTGDARVHSIDEPMRTLTTARRGEHALVSPFLVPRYGERPGQDPRCSAIDKPADTIVPTANQGSLVCPVLVGVGGRAGQSRPRSGDEPIHTMTAKGDTALAAVHLQTMRNGDKPFNEADRPAHTITAEGARLHLVAAFLAQHNTDMVGHDAREPLSTIVGKGCTQAVVSAFLAQHNTGSVGRAADEPASTIVHRGTQQQLVAAHLSHQYGSAVNGGQGDVEQPISTISAQGQHAALVYAFLQKYYGTGAIGQTIDTPAHTLTAHARLGVVIVHVDGVPMVISDIGMRMLTPRELFRMQGFPDSYVIEYRPDGTRFTKTAQVRLCGNSVSPPPAEALVRANFAGGAAAVMAKEAS